MVFGSTTITAKLMVLLLVSSFPLHAVSQNTTEPVTVAPTSAADVEDAKTQSLAWWVLVLGAVVAFPLLIGSCYAMLMWQQKVMHDYKGKFEELLKALGENRRRTEAQLRRADKRRKRLEKKRRRELQAQGIDVDVQEEDDKDKDGGMSVYGVHVNDDGLVIAFGGNAEETEALENLTPHQVACMSLLKSSGPAREELRRGPMMPPVGNTYLQPPQTKKRKQRLLLSEDEEEDDSSELDIDQFEIDRPYDSFTRARKEIVQRARAQGIRLPIKESYAEHGDGDNDLFMAAQATGVLDDGNINANADGRGGDGGAVNFGRGGTQAGGFNAQAAAASAGRHHGTEGMHSDPNMDPLSALALRSSALHSTLAGLRKSAPVKHSVDF